jgi:hypothetical protein
MKGSEVFSEQKVEGLPTRLGAAQQIYGRMQYDAVNLAIMSIAYHVADIEQLRKEEKCIILLCAS